MVERGHFPNGQSQHFAGRSEGLRLRDEEFAVRRGGGRGGRSSLGVGSLRQEREPLHTDHPLLDAARFPAGAFHTAASVSRVVPLSASVRSGHFAAENARLNGVWHSDRPRRAPTDTPPAFFYRFQRPSPKTSVAQTLSSYAWRRVTRTHRRASRSASATCFSRANHGTAGRKDNWT